MDKLKEPFEVIVAIKEERKSLNIIHKTETFDFDLEGEPTSLINNGDNSWSIVTGNISQELANIIGSKIEKHYKNLI